MRNNLPNNEPIYLKRLEKQKITVLFSIFILLVVTIGCLSSCKENPVESGPPKNSQVVISSVSIFPTVVGPLDSVIVICNASDPDGDSLVYDWYSPYRVLKFKGGHRGGDFVVYNTFQNTQIIYAPDSSSLRYEQDTCYIQCAARDGKGGQGVSDLFYFIVRKNP